MSTDPASACNRRGASVPQPAPRDPEQNKQGVPSYRNPLFSLVELIGIEPTTSRVRF